MWPICYRMNITVEGKLRKLHIVSIRHQKLLMFRMLMFIPFRSHCEILKLFRVAFDREHIAIIYSVEYSTSWISFTRIDDSLTEKILYIVGHHT